MDNVDRPGCQDMLETGVCCTSIEGTADPKGTHRLGDGPFNASALGLLGCIDRPFAWLGLLQAQMWFVWSHRKCPPLGPGTLDMAGASMAIPLREWNFDHRMVLAMNGQRSIDTPLHIGHVACSCAQ